MNTFTAEILYAGEIVVVQWDDTLDFVTLTEVIEATGWLRIDAHVVSREASGRMESSGAAYNRDFIVAIRPS